MMQSLNATTCMDNFRTARMILVEDRLSLALLGGIYSSSSPLPSLSGLLARFGFRPLGPGSKPAFACSRVRRVRRPSTVGASVSVAKVTVDLELVLDNGIGAEGSG